MPTVNTSPRAIKNLVLTIGADSYQAAVSDFNWGNNTPAIEFRGGTPDAVFTDQGSPTFTANLTAVQDWEEEDSLCNYLLVNAGEKATAVYKPDADGAVAFTSELMIAAPTIGGPVGAFPTFTVAMGSTKPVLSRV